jgi:5-methylcytosine-specific restriction endonuclease McrA
VGKRTRQHEDQLTFDLRTKWCSRCEQELSATQFALGKGFKDGLAGYCKPCYKVYWAEYYARPEIKAKASQRKRARYQRDRDEILEGQRAWRDAHLEEVRARERGYRLANLEARRASCRAWHKANKDLHRAARHRRRSRQAGVPAVAFTPEQLQQRWLYFDNKCWVCRSAATATDHVKPLAKGGAHMLCNLRPICQPCNSSKAARWPFTPDMVRRNVVA